MKFAGITILLICLFAATFSKWFIIAAYHINQQYVAQQLCENKSDPSFHCNGHCYLNKQLDKEEKPASPLSASSTERFEIQLFCIELPFSEQLPGLHNKTVFFTYNENVPSQLFIEKNFPPPEL